MPANAAAWSAVVPPAPATYTSTPSMAVMSRISSATSGISSQSSSPRLIVKSSFATWPSSETYGAGMPAVAAPCGVITLETPSSSAISAPCSSIAARSSSVSPDSL